jgi:RNA polymerase sigma-70 factor (ECF subfamily)
MSQSPSQRVESGQPIAFATTRWSLVAAAGGAASASLAELCVRYWYPVFAYARRCGHPPETAQAITQAFFHQLVGERLKQVGERPPARFREWLLAELARFVAHDWKGEPVARPSTDLLPPLPAAVLEQRHRAEGAAPASAELGFRRSFALEVLGRALNRLRREAAQAGREAMFERLEPYLTVEPGPGDYAALAEALATRPLSLVMALKRLRQRFRELADAELAETVADADEFLAERAALLAALRGGSGA